MKQKRKWGVFEAGEGWMDVSGPLTETSGPLIPASGLLIRASGLLIRISVKDYYNTAVDGQSSADYHYLCN
jgi:hypothetical protein